MSRRALTSLGGLWLLLALVAGCQGLDRMTSPLVPGQEPLVKAYRAAALDPYLVEDQLYQGGVMVARAKALPLNQAVVKAQTDFQTQSYDLDQAQTQELVRDQAARTARGLTVMLVLYLEQDKWNRLGDPRAGWRASLELPGGGRLSPVDIRVIKDRAPLTEALYPFWDPWSKLYALGFPPNGAVAGAVLRVDGPAASLRLPLSLP